MKGVTVGLPSRLPDPGRSAADFLAECEEHVRATVLFSAVKDKPQVVKSLARRLKLERFPAGSQIIREGETGSDLYLLVSGTAAVDKRTPDGESYRVAILDSRNHAFFGEGALLDSEARSATITAQTECACMVLGRADFEEFGRENPEWAYPVIVTIARTVMGRLRKANLDLMLLYKALIAEIRGS